MNADTRLGKGEVFRPTSEIVPTARRGSERWIRFAAGLVVMVIGMTAGIMGGALAGELIGGIPIRKAIDFTRPVDPSSAAVVGISTLIGTVVFLFGSAKFAKRFIF